MAEDPDYHVIIHGDFKLDLGADIAHWNADLERLGLATLRICPTGPSDSDPMMYFVRTDHVDQSTSMDNLDNGIKSVFVRRHVCNVCKEGFIRLAELQEHRTTLKHRRNYCYHMYCQKRVELLKPKLNTTFACLEAGREIRDGVINVSLKPGEDLDLKFTIKNEDPDQAVVLKLVELLADSSDVRLSDKYGVTKPMADREPAIKPGVRIKPTRVFTFTFHCRKNHIGQYRLPIFAQMRADKAQEKLQHVAVEVVLKIESEEMALLEPMTPYQKPTPIRNRWKSSTDDAIPSGVKVDLGNGKTPVEIPLKRYDMPSDVKAFLLKKRSNLNGAEIDNYNRKSKLLEEPLKAENFSERFRLLLFAEERQMDIDIRNYDMENVTMRKQGNFLFLIVPGLAENRPSVLKGDSLYVHVDSGKPYEGKVMEVHDTEVMLQFNQKLHREFVANMRFNVQFTYNRYPLRNMHRAIAMLDKEVINNVVFPVNPTLKMNVAPPLQSFINRDISKNLEQSIAVTNIVSGNLTGAPYIVFGPPGTGKTVTVVEAMKQLYKAGNGNRILACAPSNSAADLIAIRLLETVAKSDLIRLYALSRDPKKVPDQLFAVSNFDKNIHIHKAEDVMKYKVVVVTLVNAGRLVTMGVPQGHFTHIFMDEAGHALEPEAMIPTCLLHPRKGSLILEKAASSSPEIRNNSDPS